MPRPLALRFVAKVACWVGVELRMVEAAKLLLLPACICATLCCARYYPGFTRGLGLFLPVFGGALLALLAVTTTADHLREVHRWTAHYYVIYLWLAVPIASVILLHRKVFDRPLVAFLQCGMLWSGIAFALLAGFTGYLPGHISEVSSETYRRFLLLHGFFLPGTLVMVQGLWLWFAWPAENKVAEQPIAQND